MAALRAAEPKEIIDFDFKDDRLKLLLPLYKARNYPKLLNETEHLEWESFRRQKLVNSGRADNFFKRLEELAKTPGLDGENQYLLEELNLYAQSVIPTDAPSHGLRFEPAGNGGFGVRAGLLAPSSM